MKVGPAALRITAICLLAVVVLGVALAAGAALGEAPIPLVTVIEVVANKVLGAGYALDPIDEGIIWNYRVARALVAASCGASLAVSGVVLQSLLLNALADPYILGISAGASSGAVAVAVLGLGGGLVSLSVGAFLGAVLAFALVSFIALKAGRGPAAIILAGIAGSQLFNALTSFVVTKVATADQARGIMFWLLGNLSGVRWPDVSLAVPVALGGLVICLFYARALDAFAFGADSAASLGIPVRRVYIMMIAIAAGTTATMVSIVGSIGFVGLVIPHVARLTVGVRHNKVLPAAALIGAIFMIAADILSRKIIPGQVLPIGVMTALVGAPAFALILMRRPAHR
ncbi:FecCD family ABC transporter permease [Rhodospirillum rubrum]|uniref:Transport system permease protein n=1 Tax=Rhodospirillum rubrum (strain ATCC 11170 / ATH 1.1.1 / DSM 467 / LMG 4362 / NCIMB 8255 / S1) TaxID=269796 RepID=Q2RVA7_RHORT|nr:iron ABC transporter permease [Rhodospirillum rubrum]ABC21938.1 transport system permease protein [Rhodospirillum rubrum ATCC 11170]AEO47643.1 transport system permease protein [Rhodospirillum rubrum F11]MBK5953504.1 iron ABC transporter permease [Rhodospirillum rubrum]QXG81593.1 iron ABC transporter permease [Rhodospirillum rubrum]HAP99511.1 iron ABC transporter permease [Rhodospirillum rubrum]